MLGTVTGKGLSWGNSVEYRSCSVALSPFLVMIAMSCAALCFAHLTWTFPFFSINQGCYWSRQNCSCLQVREEVWIGKPGLYNSWVLRRPVEWFARLCYCKMVFQAPESNVLHFLMTVMSKPWSTRTWMWRIDSYLINMILFRTSHSSLRLSGTDFMFFFFNKMNNGFALHRVVFCARTLCLRPLSTHHWRFEGEVPANFR